MDLSGILEPTIIGLGYELVDLELINRGKLIRIFIDKVGGITVEDCARVSNQVGRLLAVELDYDYDRLEVSSPGLDRPLRKVADFDKFAGERAQIKTRMPIAGQKKFVGILRGVENGKVRLEVDDTQMEFELSDLDKALLIPNI